MRIYTRWEGLDALSALLFDRQLSLEWTGLTSVSETVFFRTETLLNIYARVCDSKEEVGYLVRSPDGKAMYEDLRRLSEALDSMSKMFADASKEIDQLAHTGKL